MRKILWCYAPTLTSDENLKDAFYEQLKQFFFLFFFFFSFFFLEGTKLTKLFSWDISKCKSAIKAFMLEGVTGMNGVSKISSNGSSLWWMMCLTNNVYKRMVLMYFLRWILWPFACTQVTWISYLTIVDVYVFLDELCGNPFVLR